MTATTATTDPRTVLTPHGGGRRSSPVLIVGCGFAGAVYARQCGEQGIAAHVIDRRSHIGGNAYDEVSASGVRVHRYGPHLLHTSMQPVVAWLQRFGVFLPYQHKVSALLPDRSFAPLPVNRSTINAVFGVTLRTPDEVAAFLASQAVVCAAPRNAAEHLYSKIGVTLTELFFRPYTQKMWDLALEDMDAAVVKRIPIRYDDEDRYFPDDTFQIMPERGYTALFANILDHDLIKLSLNTAYQHGMEKDYRHCFNSMAIDEYYREVFGPLPYRSIRFHHREEPVDYAFGATSVVNFTDARAFTRQTDWSRLPAHGAGRAGKTITLEEPCDYRLNNFERYYPVKTSDGRNDVTYRRYQAQAAGEPHMSFIGRCGTYQYLDMHQVINQSLQGALAWISANA